MPMTFRERRLAKAVRLREWADKRDQKSSASYEAAHAITDQIPAGQPILVGHHSERRHRRDLARHDDYMRRSIEHSDKAEQMRSCAENIEVAANHAIYSDDPDAIERLQARLHGLEARRDAIKAYNVSCRRKQPDLSLLPDDLREDAISQSRFMMVMRGPNGELPAYALSNLSGNINRTRKRLQRLQRRTSLARRAA